MTASDAGTATTTKRGSTRSRRAASTCTARSAFVLALDPVPASVLDAGCGTGRVAIELAPARDRRSSASTSTRRCSRPRADARRAIDWIEHDLATLDLGRTVRRRRDGRQRAAVHARRERTRRSSPAAPATSRPAARSSPASSSAAGTRSTTTTRTARPPASTLAERYATWDREPFAAGGDYAVSVHRRTRTPDTPDGSRTPNKDRR